MTYIKEIIATTAEMLPTDAPTISAVETGGELAASLRIELIG